LAQIKLTVSSNFQEASKQMQGFSELTEKELKRIQTAIGKIKSDEIDSFIQKNQRAANAVRATRGPVESLAAEHAGLRRQIETLIRNGMDPMSDDLKTLRREYERTTREIEIQNKALKINEGLYSGVLKVSGGLILGLGAFTAATLKSASAIEDASAAFQPLVGGVQKANALVSMLNKTAATTPFQFEAISAAAKQLLPVMEGDLQNTVDTFRMLGDTAGGNAQKLESITRGYTKAMLKNKVDMESLNMIAEAGVPIYTELAASMGISVQELTKMSAAGKITSTDLTEAFQKMTTEGGIFFNGMEIASQTATGKLSTLKDVFVILSAEIGAKILPAWKGLLDNMIVAGNSMIAFVQDGEKMRRLLNVILPLIAGVAAGLASFLIITKVIAIIKGLSTAMAVLNAVMAANPAILIAAAIAIVIAAIVLLIRNWDQFVVFFQSTVERTKVRAEQFGVALKTGWVIAFNSIKIAVLELTEIIFNKLMGGINKFLDLAGKLPFIGDKFQILQDNVNGFANELRGLKDEAVKSSNALIESQKAELSAVNEASAIRIQAIKDESAARLEELNKQQADNLATQQAINEQLAMTEDEKTLILTEKLSERLAILNDIEAQNRLENEATFQEFLNNRMLQEEVDGAKRIAFLQNELSRIKALENLSNKERLAAQKTVEAMITEEKKKQTEARIKLIRLEASTMADFFGAMSGLLTEFAGKNRAAAIAAKALAIAQAGINTALAFTQALTSVPYPWNLAAAATVAASGAVQISQIVKTPIPSAQTGTGRMGITVPSSGGTQRQDNVAVMAQPGETVNVSPRGEPSGAGTMNAVFMIGQEELFRIMNIGIESGDVRITTDNIQGGIAI
jgi:tape measure domain-containing protein